MKILGYAAGAVLLAACAVFGYRRIVDKAKAGRSSYSDWLFLGSLFLATLTGFISSWLRLVGTPAPAYWIYFVHLVLVFFLLVYLPYTKLAHFSVPRHGNGLCRAAEATRRGPRSGRKRPSGLGAILCLTAS